MTENKMGSAPIKNLILGMSWPAMLSMMINAVYSIVDSIFVSYLGEGALVAVTIGLPIQLMLVAFGVGSGVGVNSVIARKLGEKNQISADNAANAGVYIELVNYILFAVFGLFLAKTFISHYTNDPYILENGLEYLQIITLGSVFVLSAMGFEKILQATGDMIHPMISMLIGAGTNIILDPILIFGYLGAPALGVKGAAIATIIAQFFAVLYIVYIILKKEHLVSISLKNYRPDFKIIKDIYVVGFPAIITQTLSSVMIMLVSLAVSAYSSSAVAVLGVYMRLEKFVFMPVFGIRQGAMPIMGYNYGAKNKERIISALKYSYLYAGIIMILGTLLFQLMPYKLLGMFNAEGEMMEIGVSALRTISICFIPATFGVITSALYQAIGHGFLVLIGSFIRQIIGILPFVYLILHFSGIKYVWWAFPIAEISGLIFYGITLYIIYKKEIKILD
ncbi:MAG: MATE family efflux transporter [Peptostreptococcaceae bacterium]|nr:MATE family efflux transporter [Peptostreptococcaceae bacterium]